MQHGGAWLRAVRVARAKYSPWELHRELHLVPRRAQGAAGRRAVVGNALECTRALIGSRSRVAGGFSFSVVRFAVIWDTSSAVV